MSETVLTAPLMPTSTSVERAALDATQAAATPDHRSRLMTAMGTTLVRKPYAEITIADVVAEAAQLPFDREVLQNKIFLHPQRYFRAAEHFNRLVEGSQGRITIQCDALVEEVVLGPNGVIEGIQPGAIVVDFSTIGPSTCRHVAEKLAEGVFKIGGGYTSMAIDMGDHILVVESGQSDQRGQQVMAAAKQAIPGKPIRFVTTSHGHFDHASGLPAAVAEGATILAHRNTEPALERFLSGPRTLMGDSLSKVTNRRADVVQPVGDRETRRGTNGRVVELIHIPNEHSDGLLAVCIQHEMDHLEGRVFVEYLSRLKQQRIVEKLRKQRRRNA